MSLNRYVRQLKPIQEKEISKADIFKRKNQTTFVDLATQGKLVDTKGNSLPKVKSDDPFLVSIKNAKDKNDIPNRKSFDTNPPFKLSDVEKTSEFGGLGGKGPTGAQWESIITSRFNKKIGKPNADKSSNELSDTFSDYHEIGDKIADSLISKGIKSEMTQFGGGKSKKNLSDFWIDNGGKDGTPKTDMFSKKYNISLKKAGGSQLASGMTGETIATFNAALGYLGTDRQSQPEIDRIMKSVEDNFIKLKTDYSVGKIRDLEKKQDNLSPADKKIIDEYSKTQKFHKEFNEIIKKDFKFEDNPRFMEWYIFECLSGFTKFNDATAVARASVCVEFSADNGEVTQFYQVTPGGTKDGLKNPAVSSDVKSIAKKVKLYVGWKTPAGGPHSAFRVGLTNSYQEIQELPTLKTLIHNELLNDKIANAVLKEDIYQLDEFAIISKTINKLKKIGRSAKMWTTNLIKKIAQKVKKTLNKIKKMGSRVFEGLFKFLGIEIKSVKVNLPKDVEQFAFKSDA